MSERSPVAIGGVLISILSDPAPTRDQIITVTGPIAGANAGFLYVPGFVLFVLERFTWEWLGTAFLVADAWLVRSRLSYWPSASRRFDREPTASFLYEQRNKPLASNGVL
jgi:starvation-inducible outer membrane lipoprotein